MSDPCAICKEEIDINKRVITSCNHIFHSECFFKWLKNNQCLRGAGAVLIM